MDAVFSADPVIQLMKHVIEEEKERHHLKELSPLERLPNLKHLMLWSCDGLKESGIGNSGRASGFLMLEKLVLIKLNNLESIEGACNNGVWNERVLPRLRIMQIYECPLLKRLPVGMDKLVNLRTIIGEEEWWETLIWEDESMKIHLQNLFTTDGNTVGHMPWQ